MSRYQDDPTFFPRRRGEKRPLSNKERAYLKSLSPDELKHHMAVRNHPSGRWSHGGANRSSNIRREIGRSTVTVTLCRVCGGVTFEVALLTSLFPICTCLDFTPPP